jgi:proliferating cell nuclear antigen
MLQAVSQSASEWKSVSQAISTLIEEASFEATPEGLNLRAMDPSHIALVDLKWPASSFEKYACDQNHTLTLRVEDLLKVMRRAEEKDRVDIRLGEENMLEFRLSDGYAREFQVHLVETTYAQTPLPKVSFNIQAKLTTTILRKVLSDIQSISDHISLKAEEGKLFFSGKSEVGRASVMLTKDNTNVLELDIKEGGEATYSIEYLINFAKAVSNAESVIVSYSAKMPVRMEFPLSEHGAIIQFYLAPRVD